MILRRFRPAGNSLLFDNSLNYEGLRLDSGMEKGYEEGCTRGAKIQSANSGGFCLTRNPDGTTGRGFVVSV